MSWWCVFEVKVTVDLLLCGEVGKKFHVPTWQLDILKSTENIHAI